MIGRLKGVVDGFGTDWALLDVRGVGYVVTCSSRTLQALPPVGEAATLSIETYVREQEIRLFGFTGDAEREWFRLLQTVQGVGAKVALAVLGILPPGELASAIALGDKAAIARAPGVGPKVAARLCAELKDKAPALTGIGGGGIAIADQLAAQAPGAAADALSALVNLGYGQSQAAQAVATALREAGEGADAQRLIRGGLKALAQ